ncbi:hypothetical protein F0P96_11035 [Hymenobacter busanensis]|uniref:Uncharacterized protein n=1 Tax=Hymenobacter busanensis TaxID=2607656 RepID=A0A7L4ZWG8_9BACT|nr:archaeosortase/exosortase family protein [Hymenobacter busanensis]KAA9333492.1 hypothetical protein F0P96_11035 [Hymenobacter busanensis]QHJ07824.1 hypothetical protein GUY19_11245 [Hymenobacter busanensis]
MKPFTLPAPALRRFLVVAVALYLVWFFVYEQWLAPDGRLDAFLCEYIARSSAAALHLLGFDAAVLYPRIVFMQGQAAVIVGAPCNGLVLYMLFAGFIVAFSGPWQHKLVYIPLGIVLISLLNVIRVMALALNYQYSRATLEFNHHYTFTFVVYGCIFLLWMWWARRYSPAPTAA